MIRTLPRSLLGALMALTTCVVQPSVEAKPLEPMGFQEVLCALAKVGPQVDLLPEGEHRMAVRVVSPEPDKVLRHWQQLAKRPMPAQLSRVVVERPRPMIALVMDDLGLHPGQLEPLWDLGEPVTYAVLPHSKYAEEYHRRLSARFASILVHMPMEPMNACHMTMPGFLKVDQTPEERRTLIDAALSALPSAIGLNNHMGSRLTTDRWIMAEVVDAIPPGMGILDSRTSEHSALREAAAAAGRSSGARAIFLDNIQDREMVLKQLVLAFHHAKAYGHAIIIAHPHVESFMALRDFMHSYGRFVHLVTVEQVLQPPATPPWLRGCSTDNQGGTTPVIPGPEIAGDEP